MSYRIAGIDPSCYASLVGAAPEKLARHGVIRVTADASPGFPCRVTLTDAEPGETLLLVNHVSHDVATPFRSSYAIYISERARQAAAYIGSIPPALDRRTIALRAFDQEAMLHAATLAAPGEADGAIRTLFEDPAIAYIHAHYAAPGCFAASVQRSGTDHA